MMAYSSGRIPADEGATAVPKEGTSIMKVSATGMFTAITVSMFVFALPGVGEAQEKSCSGYEPEGGMWSRSAELYLNRARQQNDPVRKRERYEEAVEVLREGFGEQPNNPRNYAMAGEAYAGLNKYASADSMFTKAVSLYSCWESHIDSLRYRAWAQAFNRAVGYARNDDMDTAAEWYLNAWTVYKDMPQSMIQLGAYYANKALAGDDPEARQEAQKKAIQAYQKALAALEDPAPQVTEEQRPDLARAATFNLAQLLALDGRYGEAVQAYQEFLEQEPDNLAALENLAVVATRAAVEAEQQAADLEDEAEKERLISKADSLRAMAAGYFTDLLGREDLAAQDYFNLGSGLSQLDEYDRAAEAFTIVLNHEPYNHDALQQLGLALFQSERYDSLASVAKTLVDRYPLDLNSTALLANAYRELDRTDETLEVLELRESLQLEISDLELQRGEGEYTVSGELENRKAAPGTRVTLVFEFYNDQGEVVGSETVTVETPEQGMSIDFSVSTQSDAEISGFVYQRPDLPEQASDSQ